MFVPKRKKEKDVDTFCYEFETSESNWGDTVLTDFGIVSGST